ncbi:MAG: SUMF1/EgtB/PvdO family nonheme iron enzyme [Halieaceae bacterium]|nr:SUMF1/EgtB/PvdO family nonheme iron enzyme [Halieaceae bacterium]
MATSSPSRKPSSSYDAVHAQTFVGRDMHVHMEFKGEELATLWVQLLDLLKKRDANLGDGIITAGGEKLEVSAVQVDALNQYMQALPTANAAELQDRYLTRLCLNPMYQRWQRRYVVLSGGYRQKPDLTPTFSKLEVRGEGPQRQIERVPLSDIRRAFDDHNTFILLAQPDGGKTTVLQRLAMELALKRLQVTSNPEPDARLPLLVKMQGQQPHETPEAFLTRMWRADMPGGSEVDFQEMLQQGQLCILCDALNEALRARYRERMWAWRDFARGLPPGNRLPFTCRTLDYQGELAIQQVEIDALDEDQIQDFARRYLAEEKGNSFWKALGDDHPELLELAKIPYYLLMLVENYDEDGRLPDDRAQLFQGFVERLLRREEDEQYYEDWIEPQAQVLALSELAFDMQSLSSGTEVERQFALNALPARVTLPHNYDQVETPPDTVLLLAHHASLLAVTADGSIKFMHHLLQEYFAALALLRRWSEEDLSELWRLHWPQQEAPRGEWDPLPPPTAGWEETTILAACLQPDLVRAVQPINHALAARCLLAQTDPKAQQLAASREDLLATLGDASVRLRSRIEAGLLLGRLGDPRFRQETINGVQVILPDMVEIPGGKATIGSNFLDRLAEGNERPRHDLQLAAYAIARYPLTNVEYACFMRAGGYDEERYWTEGGKYWLRGEHVPGEEDPAEWWIETWKRRRKNPAEIDDRVKKGALTEHDARNWRDYITRSQEDWLAAVRQLYPEGQRFREPRFWDDEGFNDPSQPVVGVCWYEAMAYANWLAQISDLPYRLPSEPEWEWAARRGSGIYPWGWRWHPERLNSLEGRVMRTTPVGIYPHGATGDGIEDMAGNIWEWTASRYAGYPYDPRANLEDPDATGVRILRGGWLGDPAQHGAVRLSRQVPSQERGLPQRISPRQAPLLAFVFCPLSSVYCTVSYSVRTHNSVCNPHSPRRGDRYENLSNEDLSQTLAPTHPFRRPPLALSMNSYWVYILHCADRSYYVGRTNDLERRLSEHQAGEGSAWTRIRLPVELVYSAEMPDEESAYFAERQIKGWSRAKKEALIAENWDLLRWLAKKPKFRP